MNAKRLGATNYDSSARRVVGNILRLIKNRFTRVADPYRWFAQEEDLINECDFIGYEKVSSCPLCSCPDSTRLFYKDLGEYEYSLVACDECGHMYLDKPALEEWGDEKGKHGGVTGDLEEISDGRLQTTAKYLSDQASKSMRFLDIKKNNLRVLDYHCGIGSFANKLNDNHIVSAVEPSVQLREIAKNMTGIDVKGEINVEDQGHYDLVVAARVLNHDSKPVERLKLLRSFLNEDGLLYLIVKDALLDIRRNGAWNATKRDHPSLFTQESLIYACHLAGLNVVKIENNQKELGTQHHWHVLLKADKLLDSRVKKPNAQKTIQAFTLACINFLEYKRLDIREV